MWQATPPFLTGKMASADTSLVWHRRLRFPTRRPSRVRWNCCTEYCNDLLSPLLVCKCIEPIICFGYTLRVCCCWGSALNPFLLSVFLVFMKLYRWLYIVRGLYHSHYLLSIPLLLASSSLYVVYTTSIKSSRRLQFEMSFWGPGQMTRSCDNYQVPLEEREMNKQLCSHDLHFFIVMPFWNPYI